MFNTCKNKNPKSNASARVVDGKLILSLPGAQTPVVWQMDLTQTKSSALEARHDTETDIYTLTLKTPRGETIEIAPFTNKELAVEGLMAASNALENAQGQIRSTSAEFPANDQRTPPSPETKKKGGGKKWIIGIISIIAIIVLLNIWASQIPRHPSSLQAQQAASTQPSNPRQTSGVAISADDFLSAQ